MAEQQWFTVGEAAEYLRLSKPSIYRLVSQGTLRAYTIGETGVRRFRREDLEAVLHPEGPGSERVRGRPGRKPHHPPSSEQRTAVAA
jgi:excisionase family DNA binding protein